MQTDWLSERARSLYEWLVQIEGATALWVALTPLFGLISIFSGQRMEPAEFVLTAAGQAAVLPVVALFLGMGLGFTSGLADRLTDRVTEELGSWIPLQELRQALRPMIAWGVWGILGLGAWLVDRIDIAPPSIKCFTFRQLLGRTEDINISAHALNYAVECNLLRKIGGRYVFVHHLLLEHFAALPVDT